MAIEESKLFEKWNIHILNSVFIGLTCISIGLGVCMRYAEAQLSPRFIGLFHYGKLPFRADTKYLSLLKVPKSWMCHFYTYGLILSWWSMYHVVLRLCLHKDLPEYMAMLFAYAVGGRRQQVLIESTTCFIVITLMCLQCTRRCYETNCVQILSRKSQLNVLYYIIGYLHYFGILLIPMINAEGFVEGSKPSSINLFNMPLGQYVCILMFLMCWWYQYRSNIMLVNFRKDYKTGKVKTEEYILPRGGLFEYVSSPHMLCEVGMYIALLGFLYRLTTWWLVILWVVSNQIYVSVSSHSWYKKTFVNYPKKRKAIFPMIL